LTADFNNDGNYSLSYLLRKKETTTLSTNTDHKKVKLIDSSPDKSSVILLSTPPKRKSKSNKKKLIQRSEFLEHLKRSFTPLHQHILQKNNGSDCVVLESKMLGL
jgi:hypothetical protein